MSAFRLRSRYHDPTRLPTEAPVYHLDAPHEVASTAIPAVLALLEEADGAGYDAMIEVTLYDRSFTSVRGERRRRAA